MASGLESIAMAVDLLEKRDAQRESEGNFRWRSDLQAGTTTPKSIPTIPRSAFACAPRQVSNDSMCGLLNREPLSSTAASCKTPVKDSMSPEMISLVLESLKDDADYNFTGPPPKAPLPSAIITKVQENDVLCGRGGETNHHPGNVRYRALVKKYQPLYIAAKRRDKPLIASKIVRIVRHTGGCFLRKDAPNSCWRDVGNTKAREKTSQALREGAPELRGPLKGTADFSKKRDHVSSSLESLPETQVLAPQVSGSEGQVGVSHFFKKGQIHSPTLKKMKNDGRVAASVTKLEGGQNRTQMLAMPLAAVASTQPLELSAHMASPRLCSATVSADDDDGKGEWRPVARTKPLKKRLAR